MRFVALDVETANSSKGSICQIGLARVDEGRVTATWGSLVRPGGIRTTFDPAFIEIHGIRPEDVRSAPTFAELWPTVWRRIQGAMVVAHNAGFDMGALRVALAEAGIPCPTIPVACSLVLARRRYPHLARHTLDACCAEAGVVLERHHDATADAQAAAEITCHMGRLVDAYTLDELLQASGVQSGSLRGDGYSPCLAGKPDLGLVVPTLF